MAASLAAIAPARLAAAAARDSVRLAAIDVGSNSIHMIVAQVDPDGGVSTLWRMKEMVGLGRLSFPSRKLSREAMDRALATLARFQQAASQRQCEKTIAIATSAVREAENGGDFIERVKEDLGLHVRVVSAREEARLIYLAVRHALPLKREPAFIVDIGGGSVEFIVGDEKQSYLLESRKLGAARMTAQFVHTDPLGDEDKAALLAHYDRELAPLCQSIRDLKPARVIGTSGTMENLAAMCGTGPAADGADHPGHVDRDALRTLVKDLLRSRSKDRAKIRGLDDQRKDQVLAGALLVSELFDRLKIRRIQLCGAALREGILLDYLQRHVPDMAIRRQVPDPRRRSVLDLARRCDWHRPHAEQVARLTLRLFDDLRGLHGLGNLDRELIEYAALLHDIGWHIGRSAHHKHSAYLIQHGDLKGFSPEEIGIIAQIARYHRKSPPGREHDAYMALAPRARRVVCAGAALLRLADGMDRSHCSVIQDVSCKNGDGKVKCTLTARMDAELELWGARRKRELFEDTFGARITFELAGRK